VTTAKSVEDQMAIVDAELQGALMGTTKWNETRIPVIRGTFQRLLDHVTLLTATETNLPVLEIGSDGQLASAKALHALTGLDVVASNLTVGGLKDRVDEYPIRIHQNDVGSLDFPDDSFSMLFGRAVLEHISDMDDFLVECDRVLEPGGVLYLDGGPLFYSPRGHHMAVRGPSGTHYGFAGMPDLVPNWCQLESNEDEVFRHLIEEKEIDPDDARVVAQYIFNSREQNRMSATQVIEAFERSPFENLAYDTTYMRKITPPPHLVAKYGEFDLTCNGLAYYLKKAADEAETGAPASLPEGDGAAPRGLALRVISRIRRIVTSS
jgi:ubiquinone/menaquinone biosynthesis C-methylase UbiE